MSSSNRRPLAGAWTNFSWAFAPPCQPKREERGHVVISLVLFSTSSLRLFPQAQAEPAVVREEVEVLTGSEQQASARRGSAESSEIRALADAYEHCGSDSSTHQPKAAASKIPNASAAPRAANVSAGQQPVARLRHAERSVSVARAIPVAAAVSSASAKRGERPGTPTPEPDSSADSGRGSPPPEAATPMSKMISPFSKTPLISRRARRGTGFENAR